MTSRDFVLLALQLSFMLAAATAAGQLMRRFRQPAILGEMLGGIVIGVTVFGSIAPGAYDWLFSSSEHATMVRDASIKLGMLFFLFVAGSQVDLSRMRELGRKAVTIGLVGTVLPIGAGVALVYAMPRSFWGDTVQDHMFPFALFVGMNLANSANPVLARILMDLGLLRGGIGSVSMAATIVDDLVNWALFAIILRQIAPSTTTSVVSSSLGVNIALVIALVVAVLGLGRWLGLRALHWLRRNVAWPSGFIAAIAMLVLLAGSASEALGVHAFLGAFLVGAALGGHEEDHVEAHRVITQFALSFFAPIYFISMGMSADFLADFDIGLVALVIGVAVVSKLGAVLLGARLAGMQIDRTTWAIAWGLNARGATGIILASVGRTAGVIDDRIYVAIVVMAIVTSLMAGPIMNRLLTAHRAEMAAAP